MHACWLALAGRRPVGPGSQVAHAFGSLLLLADNYIHQLRTKPQSSQRTRKDSMRSTALQFLRATGSSAGQLQGRVLGRSGPGCTRGSPLVGPARAAWSSGRAGLPGKRSCPVAGGPVGHESQENQSRKG
ncbi:MAG: hypothetical protein NTX42_05370 [Methanothrix sp.]|nr:hypothetical protein [Methanothrix sp.]